MRKDKLEAFKLRKEGKSYREIEKALGVSRGTLSFWFKDFDWSSDLSKLNHSFSYSPEKLVLMRTARRKNLDSLYDSMRKNGAEDVERFSRDPLFIAALVAYACEGDKLHDNLVRITNTDPRILRLFKKFLETYYPDMAKKIKVSVLLYPDLNADLCLKYWSRSLALPSYRFHKPVVIQGRHKTRRLQYGVATLIISNKAFKVRLLEMVNLALNP